MRELFSNLDIFPEAINNSAHHLDSYKCTGEPPGHRRLCKELDV